MDSNTVWYLGYGSNMNSKILKRRKVKPIETCPVRVPGWQLSYDLVGLPLFEPAFANIVPYGTHPGPELEGVAILITNNDLARIRDTEGGETKDGYQLQEVECIMQKPGNQKIKAKVLIVNSDSPRRHKRWEHLPSQRYIKLLVEGAKENQLSPNYIKWLESHESYSRNTHIPNTVVAIFLIVLCFILYLPVLLIFAITTIITRLFNRTPYRQVLLSFLHTINNYGIALCWRIFEYKQILLSRFGLLNSRPMLPGNIRTKE